MTPCETSFDGAWGDNEISMSPRICSLAQALQLCSLDDATRSTNLVDELHAHGELPLCFLRRCLRVCPLGRPKIRRCPVLPRLCLLP